VNSDPTPVRDNANIAHPHDKELRLSAIPAGTVTFLVIDIEGSTRLLNALGDRYAGVLERYHALVRSTLAEMEGHEVSNEGDGFVLAFPRALDAVQAALNIQCDMAAAPPTAAGPVRARIGIHTGQPDILNGNYVGLDVHRAARIGNAGHGGQVLISRPTRELIDTELPEGVTLRDLGEHWLKDLPRPEHLTQLVIEELPDEFPALRTGERQAPNLPEQLTSFIGREDELTAAADVLAECRLMTLTGPGGTGKTRFAIQLAARVADRYLDGLCFVPLAPIVDPNLVLPTIVQALGLPDVQGRPAVEVLADYLSGKQMLLVLDNFEQVISAGAALAELLTRCPGCTLLVTSRVPLRISGERELPVPPLDLPGPSSAESGSEALERFASSSAVQLFVARAQAVRPDFHLTEDNATTVAEICRRLDGLPLAVELAAARIRIFSPESMLTRLGGTDGAAGGPSSEQHGHARLQLLTGGSVDLPDRQRTLRNTIAWSYDLLSPEEQSLFRRLAMFTGGFTLESAEASATASIGNERWSIAADEVVDGIESLISKSLIKSIDAPGEPRFIMLETIREYGLERLGDEGELASMRRWHAQHFLQMAESAEPRLRGREQLAWLDRLQADHDNLRAALAYFSADNRDTGELLRVAGALAWFWPQRGHIGEGRRWLELALRQPQGGEPRLKALYGAAWLAHIQQDGHTAEELLADALPLARELGNGWAEAWVLHLMGRTRYFENDARAAAQLGQQSLQVAEAIGDRWLVGWAVHLQALAAHIANDLDAAWDYYTRTIEIRQEVGFVEGEAICSHLKGLVAFRRGEYRLALDLVRSGVTRLQRLGTPWTIHNGVATWAALVNALGDPERAVRLIAAIHAFSAAIDVVPIPLGAAVIDETTNAARGRLSAEDFERAWATGAALSLDQAIDDALGFQVSESATDPVSPDEPGDLSPRERMVLQQLVTGATTREIAEALVVSVATVDRHLTHIYTKLGVRGRAEAIARALRNGVS
jgi:predicted ATPase/class 3 adenylate cyclase/DNA-binding CsgD family transcriptional regulator